MATALNAVQPANLPAAVLEQFRQSAHDARGTMAPETIRAMRTAAAQAEPDARVRQTSGILAVSCFL